LAFPFTSVIDDNQYSLEIVQGCNSKSFLIKYSGTIPKSIAVVAKNLVYALMVLFIFFIGVKTYEIYRFKRTTPQKDKTTYEKVKYYVLIILFSFASTGWLYYCSDCCSNKEINSSLLCAIILTVFVFLQIGFFMFTKIAKHTITATASVGGNILPQTKQVMHGHNELFRFTSDDGFELKEVLIDEINNPEAILKGEYPFNNIDAKHSISVTFKKKEYQITATADSGGTISPLADQVSHGDSKSFDIELDNGYVIDKVLINAQDKSDDVLNESEDRKNIPIYDITENKKIEVFFKKKQYTINVSRGKNGTIRPAENQIVEHGEDSCKFTFSLQVGYEIDKVLIDDVNNDKAVSDRCFMFENVTDNHNISVSFKKRQDTTHPLS